MDDNDIVKSKRRGRPATGKGVPIVVRLQPDDLADLDAWIAYTFTYMAEHGSPQLRPFTRPEAIREIVSKSRPLERIRNLRARGKLDL